MSVSAILRTFSEKLTAIALFENPDIHLDQQRPSAGTAGLSRAEHDALVLNDKLPSSDFHSYVPSYPPYF